MITKRNYFATVDGGEQEYIVDLVQETDSCFKLNIEGREYTVDFAMAGDNVYSLIVNGQSLSMEIGEKGDIFDVLMDNGDMFSVEVLDEMKRLMKMRHSAGLEGRQVIELRCLDISGRFLLRKDRKLRPVSRL